MRTTHSAKIRCIIADTTATVSSGGHAAAKEPAALSTARSKMIGKAGVRQDARPTASAQRTCATITASRMQSTA